jgi:tetratricopeptide (TPR) repeat protein
MNPDHVVPSSLEEASNLPPQNLGLYSPTGLSTSMTANNTGMQSTPMTPSLATPFMVLKNAEIPQSSQSALPLKINNLIQQKKWDVALAEIEVAAKKNPKNVQLFFVKSRILIEKGQLEQARLTLLEMINKYHLFNWIFKGLNINTDFFDDKDPILVIAAILDKNNPALLNKSLNNLKYTIDEIRAITFLINLFVFKYLFAHISRRV